MSFYGNRLKQALVDTIMEELDPIPHALHNIGVEDIQVHLVEKGAIHLKVKHDPNHSGGPVYLTIKIVENI